MANTKVILFLLCLFPMLVIAQQLNNALSSPPHLLPATYNIKGDSLILPFKAYYDAGDSTVYYFLLIAGVCKGNYYAKHIFKWQPLPVQGQPGILKEPVLSRATPAVHGNVTYDFFYRSAIDTPYADNNVMQHTVSTNIYATIKKTFPVVIQINARQSNSYLFKNYIDANIQFDGQAYQTITKQKLKDKATEQLSQNAPYEFLQTSLQEKYKYKHQLENWLQDGRQLQQLIESRQALSGILPSTDIDNMVSRENVKQLLMDSLQNRADQNEDIGKYQQLIGKAGQYTSLTKTFGQYNTGSAATMAKKTLTENQEKAVDFLKTYAEKNEKYKKYSQQIDSLEEKYQTTKSATQQKIDSAKLIIDNTDDPAVLKQYMKAYGLDSTKAYKWVKHLLAIKKFAIGRSMVDYSELTAKNISVTGINAEYFNRFYFAVAAGTVYYRYRDFMVRSIQKVPQYLLLARAGIGNADESGIVLTIYKGKKQASWFNNNNRPAVNNVLGISIEGRYRIDKNNFVIAEVAKSSYPRFVPSQSNTGANAKMIGLADRSNEAYSIQLLSYIPATQTRLSGQYKKLGINFQSFNIFNYNANYSVWHIRGDQYFFKRALFVSAAVKTNEYNSPYTIYNYKSNTIFTTVQATLRLKKWPVLSAAYMPSSQLYKTGNDIIETRFSTLMASASYMYRVARQYMHNSLMYNRFFNDNHQQQFMYYNASNWLLNHSIMSDKLTLNTAVGLSYNADYRLQTIDQGMNYRLTNWLRAGGGLKWNRLNSITNAIGYYGSAQWKLKKLGEIEMSFDHGFLPGLNGVLLPNDMGRIVYFKTF